VTEAEDLRQATREAHEAMKDMKLLMRDVRVVIAELHEAAGTDVRDLLDSAVKAGMQAHKDAIGDAIEEGTKMVFRRFAELGEAMLGEDRAGKRNGSAIKELAQKWVAEQS
jgi:hypothetical protein